MRLKKIKKRQLVIPIFIPFGGCEHQCVFCNQDNITGETGLPSVGEVKETIELYLSTWKGIGRKEVAFYGGSFTALKKDLQVDYLKTAFEYVEDGSLEGIRFSTRPDCISEDIVDFVSSYGVDIIELGVQSMNDNVLKLSGRGHSGEDVIKASKIIKDKGLTLGLQIMPGLPGDTHSCVIETTKTVASLAPSFVRIYPTLVIKDTPLFKLYERGDYTPWSMESMVDVCREVRDIFESKGIKIIRMGLQPTEELEATLVAGPYHPAFRDIVNGSISIPAQK